VPDILQRGDVLRMNNKVNAGKTQNRSRPETTPMARKDEDSVPLRNVPPSVFCPGRRRQRHCKSFRPAHETQARIENEKRRKGSNRKGD
jgi:hypothetical protein